MEILLDKRSVRLIRQSAADAIDDGDTETLREDVLGAFNDSQIEEIERRIEGDDFYDFLGDVLEEWDGEDIDDLFELLDAHLTDVGIELKYRGGRHDNENDEDQDEDEDEDEDDDGDDDENDEDEYDEDSSNEVPPDMPDGGN